MNELFHKTIEMKPLPEIFNRLSREGWTPAIFGGAIRDTILFNAAPFDIDVVVEGKDCTIEKLSLIIGAIAPIATRSFTKFGALRYNFDEPEFELDIWPCNDVWAVKEGLAKNKLFDMPKTTIFNTEAVLYLPIEKCYLTGDGLSGNFFLAKETKTIEVNAEKIPNEVTAMVKLNKMSLRLTLNKYDFGPKLREKYFADNS